MVRGSRDPESSRPTVIAVAGRSPGTSTQRPCDQRSRHQAVRAESLPEVFPCPGQNTLGRRRLRRASDTARSRRSTTGIRFLREHVGMVIALSVAGVLLSIALLWSGIRKWRFSTPLAASLSVIDLLALGLLLVSLGWWGLALFVAANGVAALTWGGVHATRIDSELTFAATQIDRPVEQVKEVHRELMRNGSLRAMGPRRLSRLVRRLAERARSPQDARAMAPPIGLLWLVHRPDLEWLVDQFDSLLRLYDEPATEAMRVADVLTVAAQQSAATFSEVVIATVSAAGGSTGAPAV